MQVPKCLKKKDNKYYYVLSYVVLAYTCVSFQKLKYKFTYYYSDFENEIWKEMLHLRNSQYGKFQDEDEWF
jgi:hypothetical protein